MNLSPSHRDTPKVVPDWFSAPDEETAPTEPSAPAITLEASAPLLAPAPLPRLSLPFPLTERVPLPAPLAPIQNAIRPALPPVPEMDVEIARWRRSGWRAGLLLGTAAAATCGIFAVGFSGPSSSSDPAQESAEIAAPLPLIEPVATPMDEELEPAPDFLVSPELVPQPAPRFLRRLVARTRLLPPKGDSRKGDRSQKYLTAGWEAFTRGELEKALRNYSLAVRAAPKKADGYFGVALVSYELRRDTAADKALERALFFNPAHPLANLLSGYIAQERKQPNVALIHYRRYLAAAPSGELVAEVKSAINYLTSSQPQG